MRYLIIAILMVVMSTSVVRAEKEYLCKDALQCVVDDLVTTRIIAVNLQMVALDLEGYIDVTEDNYSILFKEVSMASYPEGLFMPNFDFKVGNFDDHISALHDMLKESVLGRVNKKRTDLRKEMH